MNGKIYFPDTETLASFLRDFTGSTATFEVRQWGTSGWVLEFNGGW